MTSALCGEFGIETVKNTMAGKTNSNKTVDHLIIFFMFKYVAIKLVMPLKRILK